MVRVIRKEVRNIRSLVNALKAKEAGLFTYQGLSVQIGHTGGRDLLLVTAHMEPFHDRPNGATPLTGSRGLGLPLTLAVCSCKLTGRRDSDEQQEVRDVPVLQVGDKESRRGDFLCRLSVRWVLQISDSSSIVVTVETTIQLRVDSIGICEGRQKFQVSHASWEIEETRGSCQIELNQLRCTF